MLLQVPNEFQIKLDEFNASQIPRVSDIYAAWDPKLSRWTIWAIPVDHSSHPLHRKHFTQMLLRPFPDATNRQGVRLFVWCERDSMGEDTGFLRLDDRIHFANIPIHHVQVDRTAFGTLVGKHLAIGVELVLARVANITIGV